MLGGGGGGGEGEGAGDDLLAMLMFVSGREKKQAELYCWMTPWRPKRESTISLELEPRTDR